MTEYLKNVTDLANRFALLEQPKSMAELNDRALSSLDEEWEPLILSLAPTIATISTEDLSALLLNQEAHHAYH